VPLQGLQVSRSPFPMMLRDQQVTIIGGGLAGAEAAWQLLRRKISVTLYEMKPQHYSPAHRSPHLAELVCSNSFRAARREHAAGLLKEEMRELSSLIIHAADATALSAGRALAVDRERFSQEVERALAAFASQFQLRRQEVAHIPPARPLIIATGPLTTDLLAQALQTLLGEDFLFFMMPFLPSLMGHRLTIPVASGPHDTMREGIILTFP